MLTESMQKALSRISEMQAKEQDALADTILADEEDDKAWDARFEGSQGLRGALAAEALEEHRAGRTMPLPPALQ